MAPTIVRTILVAEDDPQIARMLALALKQQFRVITRGDGASALAVAAREPVDLLLTDIMMPILDGFELARQLRLLPDKARTPILFITARDTPADHIRAIQHGASHFIVKPFALQDVQRKILSMLRGR